MMRTIDLALRLWRSGHYGFYTLFAASLTAIFVISTIRISPVAEWFETATVAGLAIGLAFGTRRVYRKAVAAMAGRDK